MTGSTIGRLAARVAEDADGRLFTFVADDGVEADAMTAAEAWAQGAAVGARLADAGVKAGDRVLMVYAPGLDFVRALIGAFAVGAVPVPVASPNPFRLDVEYRASFPS